MITPTSMATTKSISTLPVSNGFEPICSDSETGFTSPKCRVPIQLKDWYAARKPSGMTEQVWFGELLEKALLLEKKQSGMNDALQAIRLLSPDQQAEVIALAQSNLLS